MHISVTEWIKCLEMFRKELNVNVISCHDECLLLMRTAALRKTPLLKKNTSPTIIQTFTSTDFTVILARVLSASVKLNNDTHEHFLNFTDARHRI